MAFKKETIIYENKSTKVFINQCHTKGRKTRLFAVRRDDKKGLGHYLGEIKWSGAWRQYVFTPPAFTTLWSSGCLYGIAEFLDKINKEERAKWRKRVGRKKR